MVFVLAADSVNAQSIRLEYSRSDRPAEIEMTIKELKTRAAGDIDAALAKATAKDTEEPGDGGSSESDLSDRRSTTSPDVSIDSVRLSAPAKPEETSPPVTQVPPETPSYRLPYRPTPITPREYMDTAFPIPPSGFHPSMLRPQGWPPFLPGLVPMDMHRRPPPFQQPTVESKESPLEGRSFSDLMRSMAAKYNDSPQEK